MFLNYTQTFAPLKLMEKTFLPSEMKLAEPVNYIAFPKRSVNKAQMVIKC